MSASSVVILNDAMSWHARARVEKWDEEQTAWAHKRTGLDRLEIRHFRALNIKPAEMTEADHNLITTAGLARNASLLIGAGGQAPTNTSCRLGVGNGAGTAAVGDTDLSASAGSSNRWFQIMDSTYPSAAAAVITYKATFGSSDGNFAWNEWGIDVGTPTVSSGNTVAALLLNHKTSAALGTKASSTTWGFTATITLS